MADGSLAMWVEHIPSAGRGSEHILTVGQVAMHRSSIAANFTTPVAMASSGCATCT
jgi:hypothetical protein